MSIFSKKPTTVEAAVAPFHEVASNLRDVMLAQGDVAAATLDAIEEERKAFEEFQTKQKSKVENANREREKAEKILNKLSELLDID